MSNRTEIGRIEQLTETLESFADSMDLFILFVDLCDSTEIKQFCTDKVLPQSFWITRQKIFLARTAKIVRQYGGVVVKTIGDEIMATFDSSLQAPKIVSCCTEVFQGFDGLKQYDKGPFKIKSKAAVDFGECVNGDILDNKIFDPIGTCVDRCARISKFASANEIAVSSDFRDLLPSKDERILGYRIDPQSEELKGLGTVQFYKLTSKNE
jgi:class 3 adenylate cyclase